MHKRHMQNAHLKNPSDQPPNLAKTMTFQTNQHNTSKIRSLP